MSDTDERRNGPDRRRQPRGGRRAADHAGYAPLVLVVDQNATGRAACEAILAKLRFAVAPIETVEKAASIVNSLRPEIIVAVGDAADELRDRLAGGSRGNSSIPVVAISASSGPDEIVDRIRTALRERRPQH
jgi:PleD family two-component response regulator